MMQRENDKGERHGKRKEKPSLFPSLLNAKRETEMESKGTLNEEVLRL